MYEKITHDISCDILILGGGAAGLFLAETLFSEDTEVLVAEEGTIGNTESPDIFYPDGGIDLTRISASDIQKVCNKYSEDIERLNALCEKTKHKRPEKRDLFIFSDRIRDTDALRREYMLRRFCGQDVSLMTSAECAEYFSFEVACGLFVGDGAYFTDFKELVKKLAAYLSLSGVKISENTVVSTLTRDGNDFFAMTADGICITAKNVIDTRPETRGHEITLMTETAPVSSSTGWRDNCVIRDTYKNRMTFYRTDDENIRMTWQKRVFPLSLGTNNAFIYMENVLSSMFFAIPQTAPVNKKTIRSHEGDGRAIIRESDTHAGLFRFESPYSRGVLSALAAIRVFEGKSRK